MAEKGDVERVLCPDVVVGVEKAPMLGDDGKHAEQVSTHVCHRHALGLMRASVARQRADLGPIDPEILHRVARSLEVEHLVSRESPDGRRLDPRHRRGQGDEPVAVGIGKRPQHDSIENREDRRRGADA